MYKNLITIFEDEIKIYQDLKNPDWNQDKNEGFLEGIKYCKMLVGMIEENISEEFERNKKMKAFQVDDYDVVAAETLEEARNWYIKEYDLDAEDYPIEDMYELDPSTKVYLEEDKKEFCTVADMLEGITNPCVICGNE
jgi:hypothetical protein